MITTNLTNKASKEWTYLGSAFANVNNPMSFNSGYSEYKAIIFIDNSYEYVASLTWDMDIFNQFSANFFDHELGSALFTVEFRVNSNYTVAVLTAQFGDTDYTATTSTYIWAR